jgi:hypothetical protein
MNIKRAVQILAKFFAVNADIFVPLSSATIIDWAGQVQEGQVRDMPAPGTYRLTQQQQAFLIGEIKAF